MTSKFAWKTFLQVVQCLKHDLSNDRSMSYRNVCSMQLLYSEYMQDIHCVKGAPNWGLNLELLVYLSHLPVVVEMAEFVGEPLHVVRSETTGVSNHIEMCWSDCSLTYTLTCQEEIIPNQKHTDL